jgi:hypothetical protein
MEKRYITPVSVERTLLIYERRFGISSVDFYEAYYSGLGSDALADIPRHHRSRWASLYRTLERMTGGGALADRIGAELEPA